MDTESECNGAAERTNTSESGNDKLDDNITIVNGIMKVENVTSRNSLTRNPVADTASHKNSELDRTAAKLNYQSDHCSCRETLDLVNATGDNLKISANNDSDCAWKVNTRKLSEMPQTNDFSTVLLGESELFNDNEVLENYFDSSIQHNFPQISIFPPSDSYTVEFLVETDELLDSNQLFCQSLPIERSASAASALTGRSASVSSDIFATNTSERGSVDDYGAVSDSEANGLSYNGTNSKQRPQRPVPFSVSSRTRFHSQARIQCQRRIVPSSSLPECTTTRRLRAAAPADPLQERELVVPPGDDVEVSDDDEDDERILGLCSLPLEDKMILLCLALVDLSSQMCLSIMAPFFPSQADTKGVSTTVSGWIFGVFALVQVITSPLAARLIPYLGSRFLISAGQFFGGGCIILFGLMDLIEATEGNNTVFVSLCFVLRICLALGCTAASTASFAVTANCFPERVSTVFGILETATGVGMMVGPALGGVLFQLGGFVLPFVILGGFMLLTVPVNMYYLPKEDENRPSTQPISLLQIIRIPSILIVCFTVVMSAMVWSVMDPTLAPHLSEFNLNATILGLLFLLMSAFYAVCSPIWGWIADKMTNSLPLIAGGFLMTGFGLLLLAPSPILGFSETFNNLWLNIGSLAILGVSVSLAIVPTFDKILDAVERAGIEDSFGMYSYVAGLWGGSYALGEFIGPSIGGVLMDRIGFPWMMTYIGAACLILALLLCIYSGIERCCRNSVNKNAVLATSHSNVEIPSERTPLLAESNIRSTNNIVTVALNA